MGEQNIVGFTKEFEMHEGSYIYFLLKEEKIVYIGKSNNLIGRIGTHYGDKDFDKVRTMPVPLEDQSLLETALIKLFRPILNGKFSKMNKLEEGILRKYTLESEILIHAMKSFPHPKAGDYGYVGFVQDGKLRIGLFDNDADQEIDEEDHDFNSCTYLRVLWDLEEVSDVDEDLRYRLIEYCDCGPKAVVYPGSILDGSYIFDRNELYKIDDDRFTEMIQKYDAHFLSVWKEESKDGSCKEA